MCSNPPDVPGINISGSYSIWILWTTLNADLQLDVTCIRVTVVNHDHEPEERPWNGFAGRVRRSGVLLWDLSQEWLQTWIQQSNGKIETASKSKLTFCAQSVVVHNRIGLTGRAWRRIRRFVLKSSESRLLSQMTDLSITYLISWSIRLTFWPGRECSWRCESY